LRGSVSQADAASNIAEAEIALGALGEIENQEVSQATALLRQAEQEFDVENYGGALYLSSQAKRLVSQVRGRLESQLQLEPIADETVYASPLPLVVSDNSNVREGPGLTFPVLRTIERGTAVEGHSHNGAWVRVRMDDGADGWIYQSLLAARERASE
jgi:uncharacterized protein YgiM (DUF1202 family)